MMMKKTQKTTKNKKAATKKTLTKNSQIIEKVLGIPADYQFKALTNSNFLQSNWHHNKLTALEYCLDFNKDVAVLDLGAGSGNFEMLYASKVKSITAVDYHREALEFLATKLSEKNIKNVDFIHSDIRKLSTAKKLKTYDTIIMVDVIEHIHKDEADALIKLFQKLLNPGGQVCIVTPNYHSLWVYIEKLLDKLTIVPHFEGQQHLAQYYPQNLRQVFEKHGFTTVHTKTFNTISFLSPVRWLSTLLCKLELASHVQFGNLLLGTFTRNGEVSKKHQEMISRWNTHYSGDQENLYKNVFIRKLFDLGHHYIAQQGKNIQGTVLDIGSGMGYHLQFEQISAKRKYICLDKDKTMLDRILQPNVKKIIGTCSDIPLKDHSVDEVIASHILEHLPKLDKDLQEIKRVLKKDGKLIVVLPCDPGFLWKTLTYITPSRWRLKKLGLDYDVVMRHEHVNTFEKCLSSLKKDFTITDETYYPFAFKNYNANIFCGLTLIPKE